MEAKDAIKILVPVDFTEITNVAIDHAVKIAKNIKAELYLLHVIQQKKSIFSIGKKSSFENHIIEEGTVAELQKLEEDIEQNHKIDTHVVAVQGNIFETIADVAEELDADFVMMGTHGMTGMQHLTGSYALKVIYNSKIPFIVTQSKKADYDKIKNIVFPLDFHKESKEKVLRAVYFSKMFNSEINIVHIKEKDELLQKKIYSNLVHVKRVLTQKGIKFNVKEYDKKEANIEEAAEMRAKEINAEFIMIMIFPEQGKGEFFITPYQQRILTNKEQVPVICVNPKDTLYI